MVGRRREATTPAEGNGDAGAGPSGGALSNASRRSSAALAEEDSAVDGVAALRAASLSLCSAQNFELWPS